MADFMEYIGDFGLFDPTIILVAGVMIFGLIFFIFLSRVRQGSGVPKMMRRFIPFMYPFKVVKIKARAGGGSEVTLDRGRIINRKGGGETFELKSGANTNPPESENIFPNSWVFYYVPSSAVYQPITINKTELKNMELKVLSQDQRHLLAREIEDAVVSYGKGSGFFEKVLPIIAITLVAVFIIAMFYVALPYYNSFAQSMKYTADQFVRAANQMSGTMTIEVVNKTPIPW